MNSGELYVIPSPIGNLGDFTYRAVALIKEMDLVLAEDTRTTGILLNHYGIKVKMRSYHIHNEHKILDSIVRDLKEGVNMALLTDAGTPGISDPGFLLIRACIQNEIEVVSLPGPTSFIPALINAGIPCERFCFEGFIPVKKGRKTFLENLKEETRTMVFFESPHRLLKTLDQFSEVFGQHRNISISREISKKFEQTIRGSIVEVIEHFKSNPVRGEFVIIVAGKK